MTHDGAEYHILPFMVYGPMFMNLVSQFAQVSLQEDASTYEASAGTIDKFTNEMGVKSIPLTVEEQEAFVPKQLSNIVEKLDGADRLDDLEIVQWIRERGMVDPQIKITAEHIKDGFVAYSKERFELSDK